MRAVLIAVTVVLGVCEAGKARVFDNGTEPCATVWTNNSLVLLGSPVTAICVIKDGCPLVSGQTGHIQWRLGNRSLPDSSVRTENGAEVSEVNIRSFNHTKAFLTCSLQASAPMILGGVVIRAGYPPSAPQNLSCQTNLTTPNTLTCHWDNGRQETHLPTQYYLHTWIGDTNESHNYTLQPGVQRYVIPRTDFVLFAEIQIFVRGVNELGEARSDNVTLEPVSAAKFDQPSILRLHSMPKRFGCLSLTWALSPHQKWMKDLFLTLEVRMKPAESSEWTHAPILVGKARPKKAVEQCRLKHGTEYFAQIRVRYQLSPWSEWSGSRSAVTLESAPTGHIDSWMRLTGDHMHKQLDVHLFWKPSKQFRANGRNVSYIVSQHKVAGVRERLCFTSGSFCTFQLPVRVRKLYLTAVNAAGRSSPSVVWIQQPKGPAVILNLKASSLGNSSILVTWESKELSTLTGFVVEWRPLLEEKKHSKLRFETTDRNTTSLIIEGEPYKPYGITVYPQFKHGIGLGQMVHGYSRQKAPSKVPEMRLEKTWQSHVELTWDELPLAEQNGIIDSYHVFYRGKNGSVSVVNAAVDERRVVLKDLSSVYSYEAVLMVSTHGGSKNGSTIYFQIEPFGSNTMLIIVSLSIFGVAILLTMGFKACLSNQKRLKVGLWPAVPDPANSSIKKWSSGSMQNIQSFKDTTEPNLIYLSHLSFNKDDDAWLKNAEDTSDLGESICGSPCTPSFSNSDSVPYATVVFSGPATDPCQLPRPPVYLRSESTRPLLESEECVSPRSFQIFNSGGVEGETCFFDPNAGSVDEEHAEDLWKGFPLLQALVINETENDF
ncbi:granulocyte colony-stimulating factor receptor [Synchiropus splendidus]|uniref:granulocyte colony-stimulating factor receptor n=1 Tax=Synchiropus splendidus TaxID=270530 RepID=UPI00237E5F8E|nr:granulocyte colony-stimulating factor receptor [Synchiropus splendidus]